MSYRYERVRPPRQRGGLRGCMVALVIVVWLVVLAFLALRFWARPGITQWVEDRVARSLDPQLPAELPSGDALRRSLEQIPFAELPSGELRITEAEANEYVNGYGVNVPGLDDIRVSFVPGEVQATINMRGLESTARVRPIVRDGRIVGESAELGQPLGSFVSIDGLLGALTDRINADLGGQGRRITGIEIAEGVAVVTIE